VANKLEPFNTEIISIVLAAGLSQKAGGYAMSEELERMTEVTPQLVALAVATVRASFLSTLAQKKMRRLKTA
jgi:hypothetical protein